MKDAYDVEVENNIIQIMLNDIPFRSDSELFEDACFTTVVTCGPPPKGPLMFQGVWRSNLSRTAYEERVQWIQDVEALVCKRFGLHPGNVGDFIVAFETWWSMQQEDSQHENRNRIEPRRSTRSDSDN